ncbi:MAG: branched-chain amino acid ABC transporter permease [Negativicutes bacterium]|nr:branched-chain amino acid ABC transporter permease [Negativicutes bacterium]
MLQEFIQQIVNGLVLGSTYTLIALGLTMIYGILGIVNWAHGELYMLGAFAGLYLAVVLKLPFIVALLGAMIILAVCGMLLERLVFRPLRQAPELNMIIGTLGISIFLMNTAIVLFSPNPLSFPTEYSNEYLSFLGIAITMQRLLVFFITVVLIALLNYLIKYTELGKAMRACEQNPDAARLMGIDINRISLVTCAIGAALAAAAGVLVGPIFLVSPQMGLLAIAKVFAVVILGGMGNVEGAIWSAFILGLAESLTAGFFSSDYKDIITFFILIAVLIFRPQGLFGNNVIEKV